MARWIEVHAAPTGAKMLLNTAQIVSVAGVVGECTGLDGNWRPYGCYVVTQGYECVLYVEETYEAVCRWVQTGVSNDTDR